MTKVRIYFISMSVSSPKSPNCEYKGIYIMVGIEIFPIPYICVIPSFKKINFRTPALIDSKFRLENKYWSNVICYLIQLCYHSRL